MKIKENLTKDFNLKVWHLLLVIVVCFGIGKSIGNTKFVDVEKTIEVVKEVPVNCETIEVEKIVEVERVIESGCSKEKKIIGLYDDILDLDNEAFNLLGSAMANPFDTHYIDKVTVRVEKIAAEKQMKMIEILSLDN